jgi:outer membrane protein insertion porin family
MIKLFVLLILFFSSIITDSFANKLDKIEINGNKRVSDNTIINFSELEIGKNITQEILNESLKKLYDTNFFKDLKFNFENNILYINIIELPIIQQIEIKGIKAQKIIENLKSQISLKDKNPLNENLITKDLNTILNIFKQSGYYFVKADVSVIENPNNTVNLIFEIDRGEKATISQIRFIGDKIFKNRKLYNIITSEEDKFWKFLSNKKFIDSDRVQLDKRLLKNFYLEKGYYKVSIVDAYTQLVNKNDFILTFNINAGKKYFFGDFKINIPSDLDEKKFSKLNETFKKLSGSRYDVNQIEKILDEIENITQNQDYEFIDANVSENLIDDMINFIFDIVQTENKYVKKINIFGNNITTEEFIRDKFIVDEGDPFNNILFNKSINNLKASGIFKSVKSDIENIDEDQRIINIEVEEKPTGEISAGAGYGTSGSTLSFGISENNFNGKGITLASNLALTEESIKGSISFTHPNFAYSDRSLTTSLESTSTDKLTNFGYKSNLNSFSMGTRYEQYSDLFFSPKLSISTESIETTSNASSAYKKQEGSYFETGLSYGLDYDKRNSRFQPSSGFISSWYQTIPLISDDSAIYNGYQFTKFKELLDDMVLSAGFLVRSVNSISNDDVRVSKRLFIPSSRLRGFESGKVGPKDGEDFIGGNYISTMNISTTLPYLFQSLEAIDMKAFFDAGNVWGVDYSSSLDEKNKIRSSVGLAIEVLTPVGPMSFSLSEVITKETSDVTETFRFQLGTTF